MVDFMVCELYLWGKKNTKEKNHVLRSFSVDNVVPTREVLQPGDIRQCLETLLVVILGDATGISWVESKDAAERPVMHRTAPPRITCPNVHNAESEKHYSGVCSPGPIKT